MLEHKQLNEHETRLNQEIAMLDDQKAIETDNISDGWHDFGSLYHQRAMLFLTVCLAFKDRAWKSKQHHDGTMFNDHCFIVGIDTPAGQYTYHYHTDYWDLYDVKELDFAPEYDGHTDADVGRLLTLVEELK